MNNFYVYLHRYASGPKIGEVFYVGKARGFDRTGSTWTPETRAKLLSNELRARIGETQRKAIVCSNGMTFSHGDDAAEWLSRGGRVGVSKSNISKCCHGQRKSAYGFKWAFFVSID